MNEELVATKTSYSRTQVRTFIEGIEAREKKWEKRRKKTAKAQKKKAKNLKKSLKAFRKAKR